MSGASTLSSGSGQQPSTLGYIDESIQQLRQLVHTLAGATAGSAPASPTAAAGGYPSSASRAARAELPEVEDVAELSTSEFERVAPFVDGRPVGRAAGADVDVDEVVGGVRIMGMDTVAIAPADIIDELVGFAIPREAFAPTVCWFDC